jgi:hypothetical protein
MMVPPCHDDIEIKGDKVKCEASLVARIWLQEDTF